MGDFVDIGPLIEEFFISLREENVGKVCSSLSSIESFPVDSLEGDQVDVLSEITNECRKKASQYIRSSCAEEVRNIISNCRKKLNSKAVLEADGSNAHSQRHVNTQIELLGSWSNIISKVCELDLSPSTLFQIISPLHSRVIEMSYEIFTQYKDDKNLDNWLQKIQSSTSEFSVSILDALLNQLSSLRDILQRYKYFYLNALNNDAVDVPAIDVDFLKWKELDMIYINFETAYLSRSVSLALKEFMLLQIEDNVWVLQSVEDSLFLLQKVLSRAIITCADTILMTVGYR